jgi:membrane-associated protein
MDLLQLLHAILHIDQSIGMLAAQYGLAFYLLLFAIIFFETGFVPLFFLPGDPLLFVCGAFCATGAMNLWMLLATLFAATVGGCTVNYWSGRLIGQKVFTHDYKWLNRAALARTHAFYEKHGGATLMISPYIAVVRTFAPFVAGISAMTFSKFQMFNLIGAAIWVVGLVVGGYLFGNIPVVREHLSALVLIGVATGLTALLIGFIWKIRRRWAGK